MPTDYEEEARREREASRARRRRFQEMGQRMRMDSERATRLLLDEFFPAGAPKGLLERICLAQNRLIKDIVGSERVIRELHDGINRIKNESDLRWVDGFNECARQVRAYAEELGVSEPVVNSMLRGHVSMLEAEQAEKDQAATRKVEWSRS
jgi:hypothetical protein